MNNKGSACVEATIVIPIFLVALTAIYLFGKCKLAEMVLYEAVSECSEYTAESMYINKTNVIVPNLKLDDYMDEESIYRFIKSGKSGVTFWKSHVEQDEVITIATYKTKIAVPFIQGLSSDKNIQICQKGYIGYSSEENTGGENDDPYVYVTENREAYHSSRTCSYLNLSIMQEDKSLAKKQGYTSCDFCGKGSGKKVYVTENGRKYHSSTSCSGLKRTVSRVRLSEVNGIGGCSRCTE